MINVNINTWFALFAEFGNPGTNKFSVLMPSADIKFVPLPMPSPENRFLAINIHVSYKVNIIAYNISICLHTNIMTFH